MSVNAASRISSQADFLSVHTEPETPSGKTSAGGTRPGPEPVGILGRLSSLSPRDSMARRQNVTRQATFLAQQPKAGYYPPAVQHVSDLLEKQNIGISDYAHNSVIANMLGLQSGTQTHTGAHMEESRVFARDALNHFKSGETLLAAVNLFGSCLNGLASMTVGPAHDFDSARKSPDPARRARAHASLNGEFETLPSPTTPNADKPF